MGGKSGQSRWVSGAILTKRPNSLLFFSPETPHQPSPFRGASSNVRDCARVSLRPSFLFQPPHRTFQPVFLVSISIRLFFYILSLSLGQSIPFFFSCFSLLSPPVSFSENSSRKNDSTSRQFSYQRGIFKPFKAVSCSKWATTKQRPKKEQNYNLFFFFFRI